MVDTWEDRAVLPAHGVADVGRYNMCRGDCAIGSKIYVIGGLDQNLTTTNWNDIYDADTNTWSSGAVYPISGIRAGAAGVIGSYLYVCGGIVTGSDAQCRRYDPGADSWATIASLPATRVVAAAAAHGGYLYVFGGSGSATTYRYDPGADSWATMTSMPAARDDAGAATIGDYIYVAGGSSTATLYRYDVNGDSWSTLTSMPAARNSQAVAAIGGKLYVAGGDGSFPSVASNYEYDPVGDSWATKTAPSVGRTVGAWGVIGGQYLHYIGGFRSGSDFRDEHQRYVAVDLTTNGWQVHTAMID